MQNKTLSLFLVSLFLMSFASMGMTAPVESPPSEPSLDSDDPLASAAGRQVVDYAQWEFDSTHFGMYATTGNAGESYDFWPCIEPQGWAYGGIASEPYFPTGTTTSVEYSAYGDLYQPDSTLYGTRYLQSLRDGVFNCNSWNSGVSGTGAGGTSTGHLGDDPGSESLFVPERSSHSLGRYTNHPLNIDAFHSTGTGYGTHEADNILDMGVDQDGHMIVVGTYDASQLVFPHQITETGQHHLYLNNSGFGSSLEPLNQTGNHIDSGHDVDIFIAKMSSLGWWEWATSIDSPGVEYSTSIAVAENGNVFVGGTVAAMDATPSNPVNVKFATDAPLSHGGGTNNIVFQLTDEKHMGFVAKINGATGYFEAVQRVETGPAFSTVTDITVDPRDGDAVYFIGKMGACPATTQGCPANGPTEDAHFVGKAATDNGLWLRDWLHFEEPALTMTEIESDHGAVVLTGFTDRNTDAFTTNSVSVLADKVVVARLSESGSKGSTNVDYAWVKTCTPPSSSFDWTNEYGIPGLTWNPSWGLDLSSSSASVLVDPGTVCGSLASNFHGFQAVTLDLATGDFQWANGDTKDVSTLPDYLQFANGAYASDLAYTSNGQAVVSVNLGKIVTVDGATFVPSDVAADMLFLRFNKAGNLIWDYTEENRACSEGHFDLTPGNTNVCQDHQQRGAADSRRIAMFSDQYGQDVMYLSGMVYGKEIHLYDGLREHCDYDYAEPWVLDPAGAYQPNIDLQNIDPAHQYVTKCAQDVKWYEHTNQTQPNLENRYFPEHGTQWHGGDPYYAAFKMCPKLAEGEITADESGGTVTTMGRSKYASPVGNPANVSGVRYACDLEVSWDDYDITPPEPPKYGCTDPVAVNYEPTADIDDGSCLYPAPPADDCECDPQDSIKNLTLAGQLDFLELMEITAPTSHGSPQGNGAGFYWMKWNLANEISNSNGALLKIDPSNMVMAVQCDFLTGAGECYDVFTSDAYGNYDEFGKYIGIQTWTNYNTDGGNIDAVWLSHSNNKAFAKEIVYFNHGTNPAGSSNEHELLGPYDNDPSVNPIVLPATGFTRMGADMITIVLCFDSITNDTRSGDSTEDELIDMLVEDDRITEDDAMCLSALENDTSIYKAKRDGFEACPEISDAAEEVFEARGGVDYTVHDILEILDTSGKLSQEDVECYWSKLAPGQKADVICTEAIEDTSLTGLGTEADLAVAAATGGILALVIKGFIATGRRK